MSAREKAVVAALVAVALLVVAFRRSNSAGDWSIVDSAEKTISGGVMKLASVVGVETWRAPAKYAGAILAAEFDWGIPGGLLEALLYTESRYRDDVIAGVKKSPVGALGIAQFMPATASYMNVNPLDPFDSINGAARYLAELYRATNDWGLALAAYNWGLGNLRRKGIEAAPKETKNYYSGILAAVGGAGSVLA